MNGPLDTLSVNGPLDTLSVNGPLAGVNSEEIRLMFHDQPRPGHIGALKPGIYSDVKKLMVSRAWPFAATIQEVLEPVNRSISFIMSHSLCDFDGEFQIYISGDIGGKELSPFLSL